MDRKDFIAKSCLACVGGILLTTILESCNSTKYITGQIDGSDLVVKTSDFISIKNGKEEYKKYIVVNHDKLQFPICIYRLSETEYSAIYMRCTHKGAELQVFGEKLACPAHGSEFSNTGIVLSPPAYENLRKFPVTITASALRISLK
jgi:nitrite reductase/ring-hydroxylating ferredoxin subunit